jgi:parvulin-like peptidyl-prolyl isomerase
VINTRVQEQLVPAEGFEYSTEPERVSARQVLVAVTPPAEATQEQIDAAFAEARAEADTIVAELRGGADFAAVAAGQSDDAGSKDVGGDLGSFDSTGSASNGSIYPPELVEAAFALEPNTISDPIRTQFGWHIVEVLSRDVPSEEDQLREARTEALDAWVEEQRAAIGVRRFPEPTATATALPELPVPSATPVYAPGPPTAAPTEVLPTEAPTVAPEAPADGAPTPTATGTP